MNIFKNYIDPIITENSRVGGVCESDSFECAFFNKESNIIVFTDVPETPHNKWFSLGKEELHRAIEVTLTLSPLITTIIRFVHVFD